VLDHVPVADLTRLAIVAPFRNAHR